MHKAKIAEMDIEFEQHVLRAQIAQESEIVIREHYAKAKKSYHELSKNGQELEKIAKLIKFCLVVHFR